VAADRESAPRPNSKSGGGGGGEQSEYVKYRKNIFFIHFGGHFLCQISLSPSAAIPSAVPPSSRGLSFGRSPFPDSATTDFWWIPGSAATVSVGGPSARPGPH